MKSQSYIISKHALNRTIERLIKCQNIKLNKKQVNKNLKKATNLIREDIKNSFAISYGNDYIYCYSDLKDEKCKKYVISKKDNVIVTVINNIPLFEELNKYVLVLIDKSLSVIKKESFFIIDCIYVLINNIRFIFLIDKHNNEINSFKKFEGEILC